MKIIATSALTVRLETAVAVLLARHVCDSTTLDGLDIIAKADATSTLVLSGNIVFVNPSFINGLDDEQLVYTLAVMVLLVARDVDGRRGARDAYLWNVAAMYAINASLVGSGLISVERLPVGALYSETYSENDSLEIVYEDLHRFASSQKLKESILGPTA